LYWEFSAMLKGFNSLPCVFAVLAAVPVLYRTPAAPAEEIQENITSTTYIDSRNTTSNMSAAKIKLVANALGTGSNDGSITRALIGVPADLAGIPAAEVKSARIYFYNYGITSPTYSEPNPPAFTMPDVVLYPLTEAFSYASATWNSSASGTSWSTPWATPYSSGGVSGPFDTSVHADAVGVAGGLPTANSWSYFDVTSLWGNSNFLANGAVMMFANEVVPADPNSPSTHKWLTENWANQNWIAPSGGTPYLAITTVPEPSMLVMATVAGLGICGCRYRRRLRAKERKGRTS
jgi:hypothetical protein